MSKRLTAILLGLVLLTFGGLLLVSNLISEKKPRVDAAVKVAGLNPNPKVSSKSAGRRSSDDKQIATDLEQAQSQLKLVSEAIKALDWPRAQEIFSTFILKDHRLPSPQLQHPDLAPLWQDFLDLYLVQLERAISEKQSKNAIIALNQLIGIIGESQARFGVNEVPAEAQRLHHLVREISIWKEVGDEKMLQTRTAALSEAWDDISALVRAKKDGAVAAEKFGAVVNQVVAADNPQKLMPLLTELQNALQEVDQALEQKPDDDE